MKIIEISKLALTDQLNDKRKELDSIAKQNLKDIMECNKSSYAMPLTLQSIICLLVSYNYKISITTMMALFQLYANDLVVIAMTLLKDRFLEDYYIETSKAVLKALKNDFSLLDEKSRPLYELLKHNLYKNKLYIPSNLW